MYGNFYRREDYADCKIVLIPEDTPEPNTNKYPDGSRKEPGHCILLSGKSPVLNAKLRTCLGKGRGKSFAGKKRCYLQVGDVTHDAPAGATTPQSASDELAFTREATIYFCLD